MVRRTCISVERAVEIVCNGDLDNELTSESNDSETLVITCGDVHIQELY